MRLIAFPQWDKLTSLLCGMARQSAADYAQRNIVLIIPKNAIAHLANYAVNLLAVERGTTTIIMPDIVPGKARDFMLRVIASGENEIVFRGVTVKATGTAQVVSKTFSAPGTVTIDASGISADTLRDAGETGVPVFTVPTSQKGGTWVVSKAAFARTQANWTDGSGTSTISLVYNGPDYYYIEIAGSEDNIKVDPGWVEDFSHRRGSRRSCSARRKVQFARIEWQYVSDELCAWLQPGRRFRYAVF